MNFGMGWTGVGPTTTIQGTMPCWGHRSEAGGEWQPCQPPWLSNTTCPTTIAQICNKPGGPNTVWGLNKFDNPRLHAIGHILSTEVFTWFWLPILGQVLQCRKLIWLAQTQDPTSLWDFWRRDTPEIFLAPFVQYGNLDGRTYFKSSLWKSIIKEE